MPGFAVWQDKVAANASPDTAGPYNYASSLTAYNGDPMVWTNAAGSQNRMRKLSAADIAALYVNSTTAGLLGINPADVATDSSGNITSVAQGVTVAGGAGVNFPIQSMAGFEAGDPVTGRLRGQVKTTKNMIAGSLWENTTITESLIGVRVGILISTINSILYYFWSSAATTKIGTIQRVDESNPYFDVAVTANVQDTTHYPRCPVAVVIDPAYNQLQTGVAYGT